MGPRGRTSAHKELSTPADPSTAVMNGLGALAQAQGMVFEKFVPEIELIVHGTTVTTNAVLTGKTARTALLATRGFRDALQMRRGVREEMYDNRYHPPPPIVPRELRLPVTERVDADGTIVSPLEMSDIDAAVSRFRDAGIEAVACRDDPAFRAGGGAGRGPDTRPEGLHQRRHGRHQLRCCSGARRRAGCDHLWHGESLRARASEHGDQHHRCRRRLDRVD